LVEKVGLGRADPLAGLWARSFGVFAGGVALTFFIPRLPEQLAHMGWRSFFLLALGGFLASVCGQMAFYRALKYGEIGRVAPVSGAWPLVAFLLSAAFLNESADPRKIVGLVLVTLGVVLLR
jgi:bacterial/archaeal transporter family protein